MKRSLMSSMAAALILAVSCSPDTRFSEGTGFGQVIIDGITSRSAVVSVEVMNPDAAGTTGFSVSTGNAVTEIPVTVESGIMALTLSDLTPSSGYSVAAYATNGRNSVHSQTARFTTKDQFPDTGWRKYLLDNYDTDNDGLISQTEADKVTILAPEDDVRKTLHGTEGIEIFRNLEHIGLCGGWEWTIDMNTIDLSQFKGLRHLYICWGHFTSIVLPESVTRMDYIGLDYNDITDIDVRDLREVDYFQCAHNALTRLDLRNVTRIHLLDVSGNPSLNELVLNSKARIDELRKDEATTIHYVD